MEQPQNNPADLMGSLCCTLLDRRSSVPLSGARITCVWPDNRITRFDADQLGRFTARMPQGTYDLVISARGYLSLLVRGVGTLAGHRQVITRALVPGAGTDPEGEAATALGGYITDRLGHGVGNVNVHIADPDGTATYTARSDSDGAYVLNGIAPNVYDLTVFAMERRLARERVTVENTKDFVRLDLRLVQL